MTVIKNPYKDTPPVRIRPDDQKKQPSDLDLGSHLTKMLRLEAQRDQLDYALLQKLHTDLINQAFDQYNLPPITQTEQIAKDWWKNLDEEARFARDWRREMPRNWKGWSQSDIDKQVAKVWLDEGRGVLCARFPYKQSAIDEIRLKIPKGKKAWNADDKLWEFSVETIELVVEILTRNFDEVIDLTQATAPSQMVVSGDQLLSLLDKEDIQAIYRILAKRYHPDKGGDADKMARINQIFSQVK